MGSVDEAAKCIEALNGIDLNGRNIRVDFSVTHRPHDPTPGAYMGPRRPECGSPRLPGSVGAVPLTVWVTFEPV